MIVGAAIVELTIHGSESLKQRRGVVRSISQRVRNRFNLAVAEIGGQNDIATGRIEVFIEQSKQHNRQIALHVLLLVNRKEHITIADCFQHFG